jgi:transcription initiation factor TFIIIB Brf1 subunit/transcription initiation factor TFIIB
MECPQCQAENVDGENFCSKCGTLLNQQLVPLIRSQVEEYIRDHFKDRNVVEVETSEAVAGRVLKWARLYYAVPVAVLIIILALFGIGDYGDFHKTIRRATDEVQPKVNQAITEAETATTKAQDAEAKSDAAIEAIDHATAKMNTELTSAQQLSTKLSGMASQSAGQITSANKHIEGRVTKQSRSNSRSW